MCFSWLTVYLGNSEEGIRMGWKSRVAIGKKGMPDGVQKAGGDGGGCSVKMWAPVWDVGPLTVDSEQPF